MDNQYLIMQCKQMVSTISAFKQGLRLAALQDDGILSKEEEKIIKKLEKASDDFSKELNKALK